MNKKFIRTTLVLSALFVMAYSTQAFAAGTNNYSSKCEKNNIFAKVSVKLNEECLNKVNQVGQKINKADLQKYLQNGNFNTSNKVSRSTAPRVPKVHQVPAEAEPATPVPAEKPVEPVAPAPQKPIASAPEKPEPQYQPAAPAPAPQKPAEPVKPSAPAAPSTPEATIGNYQQQVVDLVNSERAKAGLPALKVNTKLGGVAEKKAEDLRDKNYFAHNSPTYGSPFDMMRQFGVTYTAAGENIARGQKTPAAVMNGWMNSQGHKENILNSNFTEIGVGYVTDSKGTTYWVQMFIRP